MHRRSLSTSILALALVLIVTLAPVSAFAEEATITTQPSPPVGTEAHTWIYGHKEFAVTFYADEAGTAKYIADDYVSDGLMVKEPKPDPVKEGYTFDGWFEKDSNGNLLDIRYNFYAPVTHALQLYPKWIENKPMCTVSFHYSDNWPNEATYVDIVELTAGDLVEESKIPKPTEQADETFLGWFESGADYAFDFTQPIANEKVDLYDKWAHLCTVTFDAAGGSDVEPQLVQEGATASEPAAPVRTGFSFDGWYLNDGAYDFSTPLYEDITLTASWVPESTSPIVEERTIASFVSIAEGGWAVSFRNIDDVAQATANDDEKAAVAQGANATLKLFVSPVTNVPEADRAAAAKLLSELGAVEGSWSDLSLALSVDGLPERAVNQTALPAKLAIEIPESLRKEGRTFWLIRCHDGAAEVLATTDGNVIEAESDLFSVYLIAHRDAGSSTSTVKSATPSTGDTSHRGLLALAALAGIVACVAGLHLRRSPQITGAHVAGRKNR